MLFNFQPRDPAPFTLPDARVAEGPLRKIRHLIDEHGFASQEETAEFVNLMLTKYHGKIPSPPAATARDRALDVMDQAYQVQGPARVSLARRALKIDPDCADAYVVLAEEAAPSWAEERDLYEKALADQRDLYEKALAAAERTLGPELFSDPDAVGEFWGLLETRPYMRALEGLAMTRWHQGEHNAAIAHLQELLRLNPIDNQGVRDPLMCFLALMGRNTEAAELVRKYERDSTAVPNYMKAVLSFRMHGPTPEASKLIRAAFRNNPHVPLILSGEEEMPDEQPEYYSPGDKNEAVYVINMMLPLFMERAFADWCSREYAWETGVTPHFIGSGRHALARHPSHKPRKKSKSR